MLNAYVLLGYSEYIYFECLGLELIKRQHLSGPNVMATHMTHGEGLCTQKIEKLSWKKLRHLSFFENAPIWTEKYPKIGTFSPFLNETTIKS